jgi:5-methyltetrahydropteroyltriglutamate--homocysteine methyltransferase
MQTIHTLGYPRIGARRELKFALESFWKGASTEADLQACAARIRSAAWRRQAQAGSRFAAVGDFALYDPVLDQAVRLGAVPRRFGVDVPLNLAQRFALARGNAAQPAMEMTKWFDTNYHYLVPELTLDQTFTADASDLLRVVLEAREQGREPKPVLLGPVSFLWLSKLVGPGAAEGDKLSLLDRLLPAYQTLLAALAERGVEWVQIDEPALALELPETWQAAFTRAYAALHSPRRPRILLATYFDDILDHWPLVRELPVDGLHLDLVRAPQQLDVVCQQWPTNWVLSAGVVDGRNVWRTDLRAVLTRLQPIKEQLGWRLWLAPSCSLAHVPVSLQGEDQLDAEVRAWLAFADEKLDELRVLATALSDDAAAGEAAVAAELRDNAAALAARRASPRVTKEAVVKRLARVDASWSRRPEPYAKRAAAQRARLNLPALPTTTIGSFPQTADIRAARAAFKRHELSAFDYLQAMRGAVRESVEVQERLGLDVLVHGEAERNDMVEFFAELLLGFVVTEFGWVQSYGSRCVKPPILFGDVLRPEPMTVDTARYAQSLSQRPVKGMLTGPVTLLQWSFVRDDQPRDVTARQLALAVRDEVADLEAAGLAIVQIDEPAFREGLPLKPRDQAAYLAWAVEAFRLSSSGVRDDTQIHTHMCYSEFGDVLDSIAAMDADVITIETSRSAMALLDDFARFDYPNEIGPGVYDIHSPRVPSVDEMLTLLERATQVVPAERLWVNPDCGLKTRGWPETEAALSNMVQAARVVRERLAA